MTATKVVDASAIAAVIFDEPKADEVLDLMGEARLVAPTLLSYELANICVMKSRRAPDRQAEFVAGLALRAGFDIEELPVDTPAVLALAFDTKLTAYDAAYLWLARHLDADLITLDTALVQAASAPTHGL